MDRDMELIREILRGVRSRKDTKPKRIQIAGYDAVKVQRHLEMLFDKGFLEGRKHESARSEEPATIWVTDMSWEGHDFVAALDNETVWGRIKEKLGPELASMPLQVVKEVGVAMLKQWAMQTTGLS